MSSNSVLAVAASSDKFNLLVKSLNAVFVNSSSSESISAKKFL